MPAEPVQWNWHMDAVCDHLDAVYRLEIRNLLITIPPRHGKSTLASVMWPAWLWLKEPTLRMLYSSYAQQLSTRDSRLTRTLIESPWYQGNWADRFQIVSDQNEKTRFENNRRGYRLATAAGGSNTGEGGDLVVVDDPHNIKEVESEVQRTAIIDWWNTVMSTRANNPKTARRVIIGQRTHEKDLAGDALIKGDYFHLNLPVRYEPKFVVKMWKGKDPRTDDGELLWKDRYDEPSIQMLERTLGSYAAAAQLQQRPAPAEGGMFKRSWWKYYAQEPRMLAEGADELCWSWDCAFKGLEDSDYVVGQLWARRGANFYLLAQTRDRMSYTATKMAVKSAAAAWPTVGYKLVEDKANGTAVIDDLKAGVGGMVAIEPKGGKESRAFAIQAYVEGGNVFLPDPSMAPWVDAYVNEFSSFPKGANDDQVDATTQALVWMLERYKTGVGGVVDSFTKAFSRKPKEEVYDPRYA